MQSLDEFLEAYEVEHGEITDEEIRAATRRSRSRAVVVRTPVVKKKPTSRRSKQGAA